MKSILPILAFVFLFSACDKTGNEKPAGRWDNSVFIVNEGPFQSGTGTVMAYDRSTGLVSEDLFEAANGRPLGNIVQSLAVYRDKAWIVVNNSHKIKGVNLTVLKQLKISDRPGTSYLKVTQPL
jgi:hypothetical protein